MTDRDTIYQAFDSGLDWLSMKPVPASESALPWFWNWADRQYATRWDSEGLHFVQGPDMMFTNSYPRNRSIDRSAAWLLWIARA
jgi:hypothetical protein